MLTIEQQDMILDGDASFYTFNTRDVWLDGNKWYYLYLEVDHYNLRRVYVKYTLSDEQGAIFEGNDHGVSSLHDPVSEKSAAALLSFLTLREYDIEDEYFANYTPRQIEFRDCEAEDFYVWMEQLNPEEYT